MSDVLEAFGLRIGVPRGWEAELSLIDDPVDDQADEGGDGTGRELGFRSVEAARTLVHLANFALPPDRGDYGSGAVEIMDSGSILIILTEFDRASATTRLFAREGLPTALTVAEFSRHALQRRLPGQAGAQHFFHVGERAFGLYVVLGSARAAPVLVPEMNRLLGRITIT